MTSLLFGVNVSTSASPDADPVADAVAAEQLGFDFVSASDHPGTTHASYETWTMLTWLAARTTRVGVATRVLGVPFRSPAMVAKMAATLDQLSGGRLILGLGGGALDQEFRAYGLPVLAPRDKVNGLEEAIRVIKSLWTEPTSTFVGRHHRIEQASLEPKPARGIPIWLGTFGPRALAVTGRLADGWVPSYSFAPPDRVLGMRDVVLTAASEAGRDPDEVTCAYNIQVRVDEAASPAADGLYGPPGFVVDQLVDLAQQGFSAFNFMPVGPGPDEQLERIAREVVPAVRALG